MKNKINIVSFSGGKDSTAMLLMMLERGEPVDYILWCDTGLEFPQMYDHIEKVGRYIGEKYGKHITRLVAEKPFSYYLLEKEKTRGKNKGCKGYRWPSAKNRWCTGVLKREPVRKFLQAHGWRRADVNMYIGIAADEPRRIRDECYPLYDWGITERQALEYCHAHGFNWGGLYDDRERLSCWICPLQRAHDLKLLYRDFPELWKKLKRLNTEVVELSRQGGPRVYEFKQMVLKDMTLQERENRIKKELDLEAREVSLFDKCT